MCNIPPVPRCSSVSPKRIAGTVEVETYPRIFVQFKSQVTVLESVSESLTTITDLLPEEFDSMNSLKTIINNLRKATYGTIFQINTEAQAMVRMVTKDSVSSRIMKIGCRILHVCLALNNIKSLLTLTPFQDRNVGSDEEIPGASPPSPTGLFSPLYMSDSEQDLSTVVCRICDERVPLELLEAHSRVCRNAFRSSEEVRSVDDKIWRLIVQTEQSLLNKPIPGDEQTFLTLVGPALHIVAVLEKVANIDKTAESSGEEMLLLRDLLLAVDAHDVSADIRHIQDSAIDLVGKKIKASNELHDALDVQKIVTGKPARIMQDTTISDFKFIKRISSGAYSHVFLARKKKTGHIYAIKAIPKNRTIQKNEMHRVITERDILSQIGSPFMIRFFYSIIGENNLYIVMEYTPGGDLASVLSNVGTFIEEHAKIYTAQVVSALGFLRAKNIIHRDLKPDNILVSADGHLKLTDFGLSYYGMVDRSVESNDKERQVTVGTPDYMAPEVIWQQAHSFTADYWSLGCIIYEFLVGLPPFHGKTPEKTFTNILRAKFDRECLEEDFSPEAMDIIDKLLCINPQERLGSTSIDEIKAHPWFKGIDWDNLYSIDPPFVPDVDPESTELFEERDQYQFTEDDEKSILEDIKWSWRADRRRSSMSLRGTDDSFMTDTLDDEISKFPSISIDSLTDITMEEYAMKMKKMRTMSFSGDPYNEGVMPYKFPESRSFSRLSDLQETPETLSKANSARRSSNARFLKSNSITLATAVHSDSASNE